jgi:tetratricopeptide (TPR) repeat protein
MGVQVANEKMNDFMRKPGYQMDFRRALHTAHKLKNLNAEERKAQLTRFVSESQFLDRRTIDPGFYRFVKRKMMKKGWYWRQVKELGYLILLDILHPENATPTQAAKKSKISSKDTNDFSSEWLTGRQLQRIMRENYPEIFFTPSSGTKITKDKRFVHYSTIFSDMSEVNETDWQTAFQILLNQDMARLPYSDITYKMRFLHASLRLVDPDDVFGLRKFWEFQKASLRIITTNFGHTSKEKNWLIQHIRKGTSVLDLIYQLIDNAVALRWYRTIKSENKKVQLLRKNFPLTYTKEDAKKAVEENFRWFKDPVLVVDYVFRGISALNQIGKYKVSLYLLEECLKQVPLEKEDKGLCYHNIAWTYKRMQKPRKYLIWLNKALSTFKELDNPFHTGITWAYIAEAYHLLNRPDRSKEAEERSKRVLSNSNLDNYQQMEAYLNSADCAYRIKNRKWEREAVMSALKPTSELEDPQYFLYFNQRLMDLDAGKDTLKAEEEPRRVKRPPLFRWFKEGLERFIPLSPRSSKTEEDKGKNSHS